jgi:hypothetical protein
MTDWPGQEVRQQASARDAWPGQEVARPQGTNKSDGGPGRVRSFMQGATDPLYGAAQLASHALSGVEQSAPIQWLGRQLGMEANSPEQIDAKVRQREADYQAERQAGGETGADYWRMGGNAAAAIPAALAMPAGGTILGSALAGAAGGAVTAAAEPVTQGDDYWKEKRQQATTGGMIGAATGPAGLLLGRAIAPRIAPNVRALAGEGVELTPGQIIGGATKRLEDAASSMPILGDQIKSAQRNSLETMNRAAANRGLAEIGGAVPAGTAAGREMAQETGQQISAAYDRAIAQARPFGPDQQFVQDLAGVAGRFVTPDRVPIFNNIMRNEVLSRMQGGVIDPGTYQTIQSELRRLGRRYSASQAPGDQELGEAVQAVEQSLQGLMARSNPHIADDLRAADRAFAMNVRVENAASREGAKEGVFAPHHLASAVRAGDSSARKSQYARGNALLQDLSDAAQSVLPSSVPDSGTPLRGFVNGLALLGTAGGAASVGINPWAIGAGAAAYGAYLPPVRRALQAALLAQRPGAVTAAGEAIAGSGGLAAGTLAAETMRQRNRLLQD